MSDGRVKAGWLIRTDGPYAGRRYPVRGAVAAIGRDPACEIQPDGQEAQFVSTRHAEIHASEDEFRIRDLQSTNGTYVNGILITEAALIPGAKVRFGSSGPEFRFELAEQALDQTMVEPPHKSESPVAADSRPQAKKEQMLDDAVRRARQARAEGQGGETMSIMRSVLDAALHRSRRKHQGVIAALVVVLACLAGYSWWRIAQLTSEKRDVDEEIVRIEEQIEAGGLRDEELQALIQTLSGYQEQAEQLQDSVFYKLGLQGREEAFIEREIHSIMAEFGAEQYSIPPEFIEQVSRYVDRFRNTEREAVESVLGSRREELDHMRAIFMSMNLPPDLVYMVLIESSFLSQSRSSKGAAGLWQFTPATARAYGLAVNGETDERLDLQKSTRAAGKYVRTLILEFGSGSSVMLALAAYNVGPGKVRRAVRRVEDPIKQRNFWYLYRMRALPRETRQYVPKIIAAIIVGRNLERFGF